MRFELMSGAQVDVRRLALKTETGATDLEVYEALAQTRFIHFGHLVWHLPDKSPAETRPQEIAKQCDEHGIGLIHMRRPNDHPIQRQPRQCPRECQNQSAQCFARNVRGFGKKQPAAGIACSVVISRPEVTTRGP
jgi:hypothetical protein